MQKDQSGLVIPGIRLMPGRDDSIIEWLAKARRDNVVIGAMIREVLRNHIDGNSQLDRIEALLSSGVSIDIQTAQDEVQFDDMILDSDL
jgi:hypothetical protein